MIEEGLFDDVFGVDVISLGVKSRAKDERSCYAAPRQDPQDQSFFFYEPFLFLLFPYSLSLAFSLVLRPELIFVFIGSPRCLLAFLRRGRAFTHPSGRLSVRPSVSSSVGPSVGSLRF